MRKQQFCKGLCIAADLLCLVLVGMDFVQEAPHPETRNLIHVFDLLAALSATVYVFSGAGKEDARWLKAFEVFLAAEVYFCAIRGIQVAHPVPACAVEILAFGSLCVLTGAENMGKKKTYLLAGTCTVFRIAGTVIETLGKHGSSATRVLSSAVCILMVVLLVCVLQLKYTDKEERRGKERRGN